MSHNKPGRNIVVVGGGITGWITALYVHRLHETLRNSDGIYPHITVIETPERNTVGTQGSMPADLRIFDYLRIPYSSLVKEAAATVQTGTKFTGWTTANNSYMHAYPAVGEYWVGNHDQGYLASVSPTTIMGTIAIHGDLQKIMLNARLADEGKVPAIRRLERTETLDPLTSNPIARYELIGSFAAHFDISKMTALLKRIAIDRGVHHAEGVIGLVDTNGTAGMPDELAEGVRINQIKLADGTTFPCDDVFDCTGPTRRIIQQVLKAQWNSLNDRLPADRILHASVVRRDQAQPYTETTAMPNGWRWSIPVENQDGIGYVYSSAYSSDDQAHEELQSAGYELDGSAPQEIKSGTIETPWVGNCLAVGPTAGCVEPLEPVSLWLTIESVRNALADRSSLIAPQAIRNEYARYMANQYEQVADFIELHYYTDRADTPFWKDRTVSDRTRHLIEMWQHRPPSFLDIPNWTAPFEIMSWAQVAYGNRLVNVDATNRAFLEHSQRHHIAGDHDAIRYKNARAVEQASTHDDFLQAMRDAVDI